MSQRRLNILCLTQHLPIDQTNGAQLRVLNTIRLLPKGLFNGGSKAIRNNMDICIVAEVPAVLE